jgi:MFS family permease
MKSRQALDAAILIAATALTRFLFRSHYLYDIDSINFALALRRFDPSVHQPHPPGYFLYVCLGRLADLFFHDANAAFVAISIVFSCGATAMIYALAGRWFGRKAAFFAGLIFVFSPLAWFHGTVALTYVVEAFFSGLTGYLCWRIYCSEGRFILPGAAAVGIAAGFRPSSLLLFGPLFLFSLRKTRRLQAAAGIAALALVVLAWFIPMIRISGGNAYLSSLLSLWLTVPSRGMIFNSSAFNSLARGCLIIGIYFLCFGCAAVLPLQAVRDDFAVDRRKTSFTLAWIAPGLLFFVFIFLKFVNSGYLLALSPPICAWMGLWASRWYANPRLGTAVKMLAIAGCAAANTVVFIRAPLYCSYASVRQFERELAGIIRTLPQVASPRDTIIVGFDSHFLGYRHAGYYLPDYLTVQFPEVQLEAGMRVFTMQHRNTRLESVLPATSAHNFVVFPLPVGDRSYSDYWALVGKRFPAGELRTAEAGGREFSLGPVADLRFLFPVAARRRGLPRAAL